MAGGGQSGLLDLEKELTCSICTEILYRPLTLLDCLHTFCGACLKEWFSWQASQASASKPNPFNCPSCRASVRETRPNATVTTLLDMYQKANPGRGRSQEEKDDLKQKYTPGEQVLLDVAVQKADSDDERMLAEVREMSLREVGVRAPGSYERGTRHRATEHHRDHRNEARRPQVATERATPGTRSRRQIGHQSSLRSLMSNSEIDSSDMEEEILRLVDEGWLDGIDLNSLDTSQVDELSEQPSIACERCKRKDIQYELHWNCSRCQNGKYNICLQCYRQGRGCLHWYGFGYAALQRYQRYAKDSPKRQDLSPPHMLIGHQYERSEPEPVQSPSLISKPTVTTQDPASRLQSGAFCASCFSHANTCYWKCSSCNDGEWGFCNRCVNQGRCCTHPLLPVAHKSTISETGTTTTTTTPHPSHLEEGGGLTSFTPILGPRSQSSSHFLGLSPPNHYLPLTLSTQCDVCKYPIQPSTTRFHCPQCKDGDYNICAASYMKLISSGRISADDGDKGWRKCERGHRMIVVGFEDISVGQRRVVVKDLVGGLGLSKVEGDDGSTVQKWIWQDGQQQQSTIASTTGTDQHNTDPTTTTTPSSSSTPRLLRTFPPSGGSGLRALALWSYWPRDDASDELPFPRGAEILEVENINGDWFLGTYTGRRGLFPGPYVRVL
ncbi:MAG: hypothetical protein Q9220_006631 [cf. Caloplaca sp. 1 TL-2023]